MDTLFMNLENSKTSDPHRLLLNFSGKIYLKGSDRMLLYQITACAIHGKILKKSYKSNKFELPEPTWIEKFELSNG